MTQVQVSGGVLLEPRLTFIFHFVRLTRTSCHAVTTSTEYLLLVLEWLIQGHAIDGYLCSLLNSRFHWHATPCGD